MTDLGNGLATARRNWGWMLTYGILLIFFGIFLMMHPVITSMSIGVLLGLSFAFAGIGSLVAAFRDAGWQAKLVDVLFGVLALFAAFVVLVNPFGGAFSLVWFAGIMFMVIGLFEIVNAFRVTADKFFLFILGVFDIFIGGYIAFTMGAGAALITLALWVGLGFIFRGVIVSMLAFKLRKA